MKTLLIIYGISWLILLIVYLSSMKKRKERDNLFKNSSKEPWYYYMMMILAAPLIVLAIPVTLIDDYKKDKAQRKRAAEREEEQRREELQKQKSENDFGKSVLLTDNDVKTKCVLLGKSIIDLVGEQHYDNVFNKLDVISLGKRYALQVQKCKNEWPGDSSKLYVIDLNEPDKIDYDIYHHIRVDDSYYGAWQVYLLHTLWHILPHFQHGCYAYRTPIYDYNDIKKIELGFSEAKFDVKVLSMVDDNNFMPIISKYQNKYFISSCYWSDWSGLVRELVEITIRNSKVEKIYDVSRNVEFEYDCGIRL
jgi:hypothetical protein